MRSSTPFWVGSKWLLAFPRVPVTPGTPFSQTIFSLCCSLNDRGRTARSLFQIGRLSFLFSCLFLALLRLLVFLLLLMIANVHPNPGLVFPCSVCAANVTCCCCCCLPDPFRGMGAWRKTMEPQKPGNSPGSGPEVIKRQRVAKE